MLDIYQQPREALGWQKVRKKVSVILRGNRALYQIHREKQEMLTGLFLLACLIVQASENPVSQFELL